MVVFHSDARSASIVSCTGNKGLEEGRSAEQLTKNFETFEGGYLNCAGCKICKQGVVVNKAARWVKHAVVLWW